MNWSIDASRKRYNLSGWSDGYFDINDKGHLLARLQNRVGPRWWLCW